MLEEKGRNFVRGGRKTYDEAIQNLLKSCFAWIWSQSCRNTNLLHAVDQLVRSAKNETLCVYQTRDQT